jgi:hypothetical protein
MGPVAWRPPFPGALRGEETVNPTRPIGSGISINRLSRATEASLLTRLGMVTKPSSPCGDLCLDRGIRPSISTARSFARYPKRPHRPNTQARSSLGPTAQRPALPSFDRQVRPKDLAPSLNQRSASRQKNCRHGHDRAPECWPTDCKTPSAAWSRSSHEGRVGFRAPIRQQDALQQP